ncbi:MAG TPA: FMN-binding glutamate synthase family protein [Cyclobacteriaceae bacterium]
MRNEFIIGSLLILIIITILSIFWLSALWLLIPVVPLIFIGMRDLLQTKQTLRRNYPILGQGRYIMEELRPKIYQYFVESDVDGRPINRMFRSIAYQRAKNVLDTNPFGTKIETYREGYEWINHSIYALDSHKIGFNPRIKIGGKLCGKPYLSSILNISAMSYGALSDRAVLSLNHGAKIGGFAHNTGEGSISKYHLEPGGDLIWQIGTGYFGCRDESGNFSEALFKEKAAIENVKMIEIKLSQGAKPGHGGILPAIKNTGEIAKIRLVKPFTEVVSPPYHTAFSNPTEMMEFIQKLRDLSCGKPIGLKLCVGDKKEFMMLCRAMVDTRLMPDYIAVDGGEGGTGAAPLEFSNSVGMPLRDGLAFVNDALRGHGLRSDIKIIASGKIFSGFHIFRAMSLGADACYTARGMMLALGCIQALECNNNNCPTGITTQKKHLVEGLVVENKMYRVANFHKETIKSFVELMAAAGLDDPANIDRSHVHKRISMSEIRTYEELYPPVKVGEFLVKDPPERYKNMVKEAFK